MIKTIIYFFILATALNAGIAKEHCKKELFEKCLESLERSVVNHLDGQQSTYCQSPEEGRKCIQETPESCKEEYPETSKLISSFDTYLSKSCKPAFVAPCLPKPNSKGEGEADHCKTIIDDPPKQENLIEEICRKVHFMECTAAASKKGCENDENRGQNIERYYIQRLPFDVCPSNARILGFNYWILTAMILVLFSITNKF